jgi:hypothetical protein
MSGHSRSAAFIVNRSIPVQDTIQAIKRGNPSFDIHGDLSVLDNSPTLLGDVVHLQSFHIGSYISAAVLQEKYAVLNLYPDIQAFVQYVQAYPDFADQFPRAMQWQDGRNKFGYVAFGHWDDLGVRGVSVDCGHEADLWDGCYMFSGFLKNPDT